jgi:hypothetical protein
MSLEAKLTMIVFYVLMTSMSLYFFIKVLRSGKKNSSYEDEK